MSSSSDDFEQGWKQQFNRFARLRDDDAGVAGWSPTGLEARVRRFAELWAAPEHVQRWLDAGCGAGTYTRLLADRGLRTVGVDYSLLSIKKAQLRSANIEYVVSDVRRLPFEADSFDGVLCFGVMQALSESNPAIRELVLVTRPGGEVWVDALNRWCLVHAYELVMRWLRGRPIHLRYDTPASIIQAMISSGVRDVRVHWMAILPARLQLFQPLIESRPAQWVFRFVPFLGPLLCHAFIVSGRKAIDR